MEKHKVRIRVYHGPANIAGIGGYLASWQRMHSYISEFITYNDLTMRQNHDLNLRLNDYGRLNRSLIMFLFFTLCLLRYDIFHFYYGKTLLPLGLDLPILKLFRKKIIMTYCGSDIRIIKDVEQKINPYYNFLNGGPDSARHDSRKKRMMKWQNLWVDRFFAARSLYQYASIVIPKRKIINDIWINNTMDLTLFYPSFKTNNIPVLVHAPSDSLIKGTRHVEKVIKSLKSKGYQFEYKRLEKIPNTEVQRIYSEEADIIIDQFYISDFGNLAVEGMFYGKAVCSFLSYDFFKTYPDCPIIESTIDNLKEKLVWLIEHPDERVRIGKEGRAFVEKYCDREKINQRILKVYQGLFKGLSA